MSDLEILEILRQRLAGRRVALVHDWLNGMRGGEKVLEHLCALFPRADLYTLFYEPDRISPAIWAMNVVESPFASRFPSSRRHYRKLLPLLPRMAEALPTADYDLVIATSHCVAKGVPPPRNGALLAYVFSPMRYVWDHFEDYLGGGFMQDTALRVVRRRLQDWDRRTAQRIDSIVSDSAHIARKVERFWGRMSGVIYPSVDVDFFTPKSPAADSPTTQHASRSTKHEEHYLVVSALVPYKRVERAIAATGLAGKRLVVVGDGPERDRLRALAGPHVEFKGWVDDNALREEYRRCAALIYPNVEDYGITALEAQACGRPVMALRAGGAAETVVDGETGAFFDEPTPESLAELLRTCDPLAFDPARIRAHAEDFSPARFRRELAEWVLRETNLRLL
ncbi:MAG: glycosyltransferase [Sumerlaeia bacterium]